MDFLELVRATRTCRKFRQAEGLPEGTLTWLVECARLASCAGNAQALRFALAESAEACKTVYPALKWAALFKDWDGPAEGERPLVDHEDGAGRHDHAVARARDDGRGGRRDAIDLHGHLVGVVHQHIVDLSRRHAVAAGRIDPDGDVPVPGHQLLFEKLGCDVIVKPAFLGDGAVQIQRPFRRSRLRLGLILPLPKLLHRHFPPFRHRWVRYLQKPPRP